MPNHNRVDSNRLIIVRLCNQAIQMFNDVLISTASNVNFLFLSIFKAFVLVNLMRSFIEVL